MSLERRMNRAVGRKYPWGVVELYQPMGNKTGVWTAFWIQLGGPRLVSVECDYLDRANNICRDTWLRARRALGVPSHILVLDQETARRVRAAVPASVPVRVEEHPVLRRHVDQWVDTGVGEGENTHSFFN
jgi:hypothetical protein